MKITEIRAGLKKNSLVFFTYKKLTDDLYRSGYADYILKKQVKSKEIIREELGLMEEYWRCDPMAYFRYRLYEKKLSREELLDYIPPYYFYNYYVPSIYSEQKIRDAASKILMNDYLTSRQVNVPVLVAIVTAGKILSAGKQTGYNGLIRKLRKSDSAVFFMKPEIGRGGKGIFRIEKIGMEFFINDEIMSHEYFMKLTVKQNYIIQEGVIQRSDLMKIYPFSVNTIRILTQNFDNNPVISAAVFRVGRRGTFVDNASSGGISMNVDLETGKIASHAMDIENNIKFERHPDTGFSFEGFAFAGWQEICREILCFASKTPEFPEIGWDIAITQDGIKAIEINLNYGIDLHQGIGAGLRRKLNIVPYRFPKKCS